MRLQRGWERGSNLDVASELSGGVESALRVLAESKPSLSSQPDPVSVSIVDAAWSSINHVQKNDESDAFNDDADDAYDESLTSDEASDAALAVAVKLDST